MSDETDFENQPLELRIDGTRDLHTFRPGEAASLVADYLSECRRRGILDARIIHGKGTGALRRTVHAALDRLPFVEHYALAGAGGGGWGATLVRLRPLPAGGGGSSSCRRVGPRLW